jgi:hypothetical protein
MLDGALRQLVPERCLIGGQPLELQTSRADLRRQRLRLLGRKVGTGQLDQFQPQRLQLVRQVFWKRAGRHRVGLSWLGCKQTARTLPPGPFVLAERMAGSLASM